ncbi:MAG: Flp family type IVb pilin [Asticcacaulis sp.]|nr:Flp family type IVb pilin [Asticcacaulis sp.]
MLRRFLQDESGATVIEYALICALIFLVLVTALYTYRDSMAIMYGRIGNAVTGATGG